MFNCITNVSRIANSLDVFDANDIFSFPVPGIDLNDEILIKPFVYFFKIKQQLYHRVL